MPKTCPVCGQPTEKEPGFYYGTGYVSYALGVAISITTFIAWYVTIGMSVHDNRFFYWLICPYELFLQMTMKFSEMDFKQC